MDYKGQSELLLKDAAEFAEYNVPGYIVGDFRQASKSITDLLARAEAAEAELEQRNAYYDQMVDALAAVDSRELEEAKEKLKSAEARAEKAEREKKAALKWIREFLESIDMPCKGCKHDTTKATDIKVCARCSKDSDKWKWNGGKKEE